MTSEDSHTPDAASTVTPPATDVEDKMDETDVDDEPEVVKTPEELLAEATEFKNQGNGCYKKGDYYGAIDLYAKAIETSPNTAAFYGNRAAAFIMLKKYADAAEDCRQAIRTDEKFAKAYARGVQALVQLGQLREAKVMLDKCAEHCPAHNIQALVSQVSTLTQKMDRVQGLIQANNFTSAMSVAKGLLSDITESMSLRLLVCEIMLNADKAQEALSMLTTMLRMDKNNGQALFLRGRALYLTGDHAQASNHFKRVLQLDPDHKDARLNFKQLKKMEAEKTKANDSFKRGRMAEAIESYTACLELDPKNSAFNAKLLCNRATAKLRLKQFGGVLEDCDACLKLDERYYKALLRKSSALQGLERFEEAVKVAETAAELCPEQRDVSEAVREAQVALKKSKRVNPYKLLKITPDASERDIKKAYRRAALEWHPDKQTGKTDEEKVHAEKKFKDISNAYAVLSDAQKKARYDAGHDMDDEMNGGQGQPSGFGGGGGGMGGMDVNDIFSQFMRQQGGGGGGMGGNPFGGGMGGFR